MTHTNFNPSKTLITNMMLAFLAHGYTRSNPLQLYVALFSDSNPQQAERGYVDSSTGEFVNLIDWELLAPAWNSELSFTTGVQGYSRKPIGFSQTSIVNDIVTFTNNVDLVWTNTGTIDWPAPTHVLFSYSSTPALQNGAVDAGYISSSESPYPVQNNLETDFISDSHWVTFYTLPTELVKIAKPGDDYRIESGKIRITYS